MISPWETLHVLDHHHHIYACSLAGVQFVKIKVVHDFREKQSKAKDARTPNNNANYYEVPKTKMKFRDFWKKMNKLNCAHLYDQFGQGPRDPLYLPPDIRGMADDPYRSLAWLVRKEGGFLHTGKTFAEFAWANYFRKHNLLRETGRRGIVAMLNDALLLAQDPAAKKLPGFKINKKLIEKTKERIAKKKPAKTKFVFGRHPKGIGGVQPLK